MPIGMMVTKENQILHTNKKMHEMMGKEKLNVISLLFTYILEPIRS